MKQSTSKSRPPSTPEQRRQWISRFRTSGLTQAEFARQHGLKVYTLQAWLYREGRSSASPPQVGTQGDTAHRTERRAVFASRNRRPAPAVGFREVRIPSLGPSGPWAAEVQWPDGVVLRLGATASASWIESWLKVVR
jgi:hypothetical protein